MVIWIGIENVSLVSSWARLGCDGQDLGCDCEISSANASVLCSLLWPECTPLHPKIHIRKEKHLYYYVFHYDFCGSLGPMCVYPSTCIWILIRGRSYSSCENVAKFACSGMISLFVDTNILFLHFSDTTNNGLQLDLSPDEICGF